MGKAFIRPRALQQGDLVRLIRPAGAFDMAAMHAGVQLLHAWGLKTQLGSAAAVSGYYYAGPRADRAQDLKDALACPNARALWAIRGGAGTAQLLDEVDDALGQRLAQDPPWFVGFSDITTLHARCQAHRVQSLHGANVVNLSQWSAAAQRQMYALLHGGADAQTRAQHYEADLLLAPQGAQTAHGRIMGGNLSVLASLVGTGALPSLRGALLFVEDIDERPYRLDRCLQQLVAAGALRGIRGILLGQLTRCDDIKAGYTAWHLLRASCERLNVPVFAGLPWGHEASSEAVVLGGMARVRGRASQAGP